MKEAFHSPLIDEIFAFLLVFLSGCSTKDASMEEEMTELNQLVLIFKGFIIVHNMSWIVY